MSVDLIRRKIFLGKPITLVPETLGASTGDYYHQDTNYTYRLTSKGKADWILTFVSDDSGRVDKVFIRKSCCSVSKKVVNGILSLVPLP